MASAIYTCTTCHRGYQRKGFYSRHVLLCEILSKSVKERQQENEEQADTPTVRALYEVILELTSKMTKMEHRLQELTKWADVKKRKINILEWLNIQKQKGTGSVIEGSFETMLVQLSVTRQHLDYLFRADYPSTILQILQDHLPIDDTSIIKAFEQKTNVFYVYSTDSGEKKWLIMTELMLQKLIFVADKKLLGEFILWQTENAAKMKDDDFAIKYALNVKKAMGGNLTREQNYARVKNDLYKYLKVSMKNMLDCEFD